MPSMVLIRRRKSQPKQTNLPTPDGAEQVSQNHYRRIQNDECVGNGARGERAALRPLSRNASN